MCRVAFVGGGEVGQRFLAILAERCIALGCSLVAMVPTNKADATCSEAAGFAARHGIAVLPSVDSLFRDRELDVVVSAGNHFLFKPEHIAAVRRGIINFHAAPLPEYRGSACPAFAILEGETAFGITFHLVSAELDAGPILHVERFAILPEWTSGDLDHACIENGAQVFSRRIDAWLTGALVGQPMRHSTRPPYRRADIERYRKVDFAWPTEKLWRHVRACDWDGVLPPAYVEIAGARIFLTARQRGTAL